jgi:glutamate 5-kinase
MPRRFPRKIKRIVIKVGSSVIATYKMKPRIAHLKSLVNQICEVQRKGVEVILVSSGAIVFGMGELEQKARPSHLAGMQALAAIGQTILMNKYNDLFQKNNVRCAQVLLTWDDFDERRRYNNARNAFRTMLDWNIVPIVNENDTISTEEIKFGDNDKLSSFVASLVEADLLLILSDVEGFYNLKTPEKTLFKEIKRITRDIEGLAQETSKKNTARGGMMAKLEAIKIASQAKIPCVIANGETENVLVRILKGERIGTFFSEREKKVIARKHWISFGAKPKGELTVDDGAKRALLKGGNSLLLPGIVSWNGHFKKDDVVVVKDAQGEEFARGVVRYSNLDLTKMEDKKGKAEAIHYDHLVLNQR